MKENIKYKDVTGTIQGVDFTAVYYELDTPNRIRFEGVEFDGVDGTFTIYCEMWVPWYIRIYYYIKLKIKNLIERLK